MNVLSQAFEKHFTARKNDQTIIDLLSDHCPAISRQKLKLAMQYGAVWLTSIKQKTKTVRVRRAKRTLLCGDEVHLYYNEDFLFSEITPAKLISDEGAYSVWNKPNGMFSQGTKWGDHSSITRWVEVFGLALNGLQSRQTYLVHRLDKASNGLILVAHTKKMTSQLADLFENRKVEKHYSAVVRGQYSLERLSQLKADIDGKPALTVILSSEYTLDDDLTSLVLKIKTGRKHQIRKHLSCVGFPIIGDRLYGNDKDEIKNQSDLMLRSCYLAFNCPFSQHRRIYQLESY